MPKDIKSFADFQTQEGGTEDLYPGLYEDGGVDDMELPDDQTVNGFGEADLGADPGELDLEDVPEGTVTDTMPPDEPTEEEPAAEPAEEEPASEEETPVEEPAEETPVEEPAPEDGTTDGDEEPDVVPMARLKKETRRRKQQEERIAELEQRLAAQGDSEIALDLKTDIAEFQKQLLDGNTDASGEALNALLQRAVKVGQDSITSTLDARVEAIAARSQQTSTVDEVIADLTTTYPVFNDQAQEFDPALSNRANALASAYMQEGQDPATAFELAAEDALRAYRPDLLPQEQPKIDPAVKEKVVTERRKKAVEKTVQAANQPAPMPTQTTVDDKPDVMALSDKEFASLTERELAIARGDYI